jgi:exopolyphosphatase/guanosine-5'-triphosphate,3'-diphosphate pyrophosphatase
VSATLAAVDIGTNSVHLVVARVDEDRLDVLESEREMVRLGSSAGDMKRLAPDAIDRGIAALRRFAQVAAIHGAPVRAVATSAVREAENRDEFLERARAAGVEVDVISGFEEARLIHLGVLRAVPVFDRRVLVCDIGGGSTELVVGTGTDVLTSRSLKMGAIRLTQRHFPDGRASKRGVEACRRDVQALLAPVAPRLRRAGFEVFVGSSGTIETVVAMAAARAAARDDRPPPRTLNATTVSRDDVDEVVRRLVKAPTAKERARIPGLDARRADIILGGSLILEQVMHVLDIGEVTFSSNALREGVLLDTWRRQHGGSLHHLSDLRRRSVLQLAGRMDEDPAHSAQVADLALQLFDATVGLHGLGDDSREVLHAAALLANVGLFVSHAGHHRHSYYLIRNSELLLGFTDHEIELIALVARYHRKSHPKRKHPEFAALDPEDQRRVRVLAGLLRVAVGLDRNHGARVAEVAARTDGDRLVVEAVPADGQDVSLELYAANARSALLSEALDRPVAVVARAGAEPEPLGAPA